MFYKEKLFIIIQFHPAEPHIDCVTVEFSLVFSLSKVRREFQVVASKPGGREKKGKI